MALTLHYCGSIAALLGTDLGIFLTPIRCMLLACNDIGETRLETRNGTEPAYLVNLERRTIKRRGT
jgi:hypothetical protein